MPCILYSFVHGNKFTCSFRALVPDAWLGSDPSSSGKVQVVKDTPMNYYGLVNLTPQRPFPRNKGLIRPVNKPSIRPTLPLSTIHWNIDHQHEPPKIWTSLKPTASLPLKRGRLKQWIMRNVIFQLPFLRVFRCQGGYHVVELSWMFFFGNSEPLDIHSISFSTCLVGMICFCSSKPQLFTFLKMATATEIPEFPEASDVFKPCDYVFHGLPDWREPTVRWLG